MAIEFICPTCQQQLRVPDTAAGKNAKCPKCASILVVPAAKEELSPLAPPPQAGFNFAPLPSAPTAKPATSPAPKTFVAPARGYPTLTSAGANPFATDPGQLPATTQAMMPLGSGPLPTASVDSNNPYAAPQYVNPPGHGPNVRVELTPIVDHAIRVWQDNLGVLMATTLMQILIPLALNGLMFLGFFLATAIRMPVIFVISVVVFVALYPFLVCLQVYLAVGEKHVCLMASRGLRPSVSDMFIGLDRLWPSLGFMLLLFPIAIVSVFLLHAPLIIFLLFYWPSSYLIVDRKCGVMESFGLAQRLTEGNKMTSFLIALVGSGFVLLGELALCVGILFAIPLVNVMWSTAYLMMSGQIPVPPRPRPYPQQPPGYGPPGYGPQQGPPAAGFLPASGK